MTVSAYHEVNETPLYEAADGTLIPRIWANFAAGKIPVEELDDEELHQERLKNKHGTFAGGPPKAVPRALRKAMQSEIQRRYSLKYQAVLPSMQEVFIDVALDTSADPSVRLRASQYVQERLVGKVPDKVEVSAEIKPWEGLVADIVNDMGDDDDAAALDDGQ
jgi:hypothetical protein